MKLHKNYIVLSCIYIATIFVVLYSVFLYKKTNIFHYDEKMGMFVLDISDYDKLHDNIRNYSFENDSFIIYYSSNGVDSSLRQIIIDSDLSNEFLYIDNFSVLKKILKDFSDNTFSVDKDKYFVYFDNGKIEDLVPCSSMNYIDYKNYFSKVGLIWLM